MADVVLHDVNEVAQVSPRLLSHRLTRRSS
jgi:hypothetical protein